MFTFAATAAVLCAFAPGAIAQDAALPQVRSHIDPSEDAATQAAANPDAPRLKLKADTSPTDIRRGYLYVVVQCDVRCDVDVTATTKISGKQREIAAAGTSLRANTPKRLRMRIRSDIRRRVSSGAKVFFNGSALPPAGR